MKDKEKNKKFDLLIAIGVVLGIYLILSYFIPVGYYSSSTYVGGSTEPLGIVGILKTPLYSVAIFIQYLIVFLAIGGLYAVISKTGVYDKIVNNIAKKFDKKKTLFLIISIIVFALLSSLSGLPIVLFTLVPFVCAVILALGYDKLTALASTVGAILIGQIGSTYGNTLVFKSFFEFEASNYILAKFILLAVLVFLLIMLVLVKNKVQEKQEVKVSKTKKTKKNTQSEEITEEKKKLEIPFYGENKETNKSIKPLIIVFIAFIVISFIGMFNWYYAFGIQIFNEIATSISEFKIGNIAIFSNLLGSFTELGQWGNYEFATFILFVTMIIGWIYSIKPSEFIETYFDGIKKMLKTAIYVAFACVIFALMVNAENGTIHATITNFILGLSDSFNVLLVSIAGSIGGFFYNDFIYLVSGTYGVLGAYAESILPIVSIIFQASYGFAMLILPVSVILVAGLKFLDVSYKDWIKYIWKLLLQIFVIIILFGLILTMLV